MSTFDLQEFKAIWNFKREKTGQISEDLEPWDETYHTALMKSSAYDSNPAVYGATFIFVFPFPLIYAL